MLLKILFSTCSTKMKYHERVLIAHAKSGATIGWCHCQGVWGCLDGFYMSMAQVGTQQVTFKFKVKPCNLSYHSCSTNGAGWVSMIIVTNLIIWLMIKKSVLKKQVRFWIPDFECMLLRMEIFFYIFFHVNYIFYII